MIEDLALLWFV